MSTRARDTADVVEDVNVALGSKLDLAGGKILQVVRATDSTARTTTSTTFVDVTGMSVTITPQKNDSAILVVASVVGRVSNTTTSNFFGFFSLTDASDNALSGSGFSVFGPDQFTSSGTPVFQTTLTLIAYSTPATIDATTYKLRFRSSVSATTTEARNNQQAGQIYAIEVSA
jgi:hypothetical protein